MVRTSIITAAIIFAFLTMHVPVVAQTSPTAAVPQPVETSSEPEVNPFARLMGGPVDVKPLTPAEEARVPLARAVVGAMMPDGFAAAMMGDMMNPMLSFLARMNENAAEVEQVVERQVGLPRDRLPDLSDEERAQVLTLLDPTAKERAARVSAASTTAMEAVWSQIEASLRDGFAKAYAVRFSEAELRDTQRFFATPSGMSFARQSLAVQADPHITAVSATAMLQVLASFPQRTVDMERSIAELPRPRSYADLSLAERRKLARLLGMGEGQLRQAMDEAEQTRKAEQARREQRAREDEQAED